MEELGKRRPQRAPCEPHRLLYRAEAYSPHMATDQLPPISSYNEFYFLTHPALFIEDHFPDNKNWQLLKPPQSLRQFESNMYHKSEFYNKGMLSAHPETSVIKTGKPGAGGRHAGSRDRAARSVPQGVGPPGDGPARAQPGPQRGSSVHYRRYKGSQGHRAIRAGGGHRSHLQGQTPARSSINQEGDA